MTATSPAFGQQPSLESLSFMSGCWEGTFQSQGGAGTIEEHYTTRTANVMLGTTRYIVGPQTAQFEFTLIRHDSTGIWLTPYPNGRRSEHDFRLTVARSGEAIFEAPEHDYPTRIIYRQESEGRLRARIDGGPSDSEGREWQLQRAACLSP